MVFIALPYITLSVFAERTHFGKKSKKRNSLKVMGCYDGASCLLVTEFRVPQSKHLTIAIAARVSYGRYADASRHVARTQVIERIEFYI